MSRVLELGHQGCDVVALYQCADTLRSQDFACFNFTVVKVKLVPFPFFKKLLQFYFAIVDCKMLWLLRFLPVMTCEAFISM